MTAYLDTCPDCGPCLSCGRRWCPQETPSPGEGDGLCVACWLAEDGGEELCGARVGGGRCVMPAGHAAPCGQVGLR